VWGKLGKAALAQIAQIVRDETRAEFQKIVNPSFMKAMTEGRRDFERMLDVVIGYEDRLVELERRLKVVETILSKLPPP
jgi:hypothetical protein